MAIRGKIYGNIGRNGRFMGISGSLWEFYGNFLWEFFEHGLTCIIIALIAFAMNRSLLIRPCGKGFREAADSRTPQFRFGRQVLMLRQHIAHHLTEQVVTFLGDEPRVLS